MAITNGFVEGDWASDGHKYVVFTGSSTQSYVLPDAAKIHVYTLKLKGTGAVTVTPFTSGQTIDGATSYSLSSQYAKVTLLSDGAVWNVM